MAVLEITLANNNRIGWIFDPDGNKFNFLWKTDQFVSWWSLNAQESVEGGTEEADKGIKVKIRFHSQQMTLCSKERKVRFCFF